MTSFASIRYNLLAAAHRPEAEKVDVPAGRNAHQMIGRTLAHYHITAAIGAGGMGEVFRATDTKLGRDIALKILPAEMAQDPDRLARFQREARALAALNDPHIVYHPPLAAYEAFPKGRHHYYRFTSDDFARAEQSFMNASHFDPQWAEPHAALGDVYFLLGFYGWRPLDEMMPLARTEATRALELSPSQPMAHAVLSAVAGLHDYDWHEAERHFVIVKAAESVGPNERMLCALFYLLARGWLGEAVEEMNMVITS